MTIIPTPEELRAKRLRTWDRRAVARWAASRRQDRRAGVLFPAMDPQTVQRHRPTVWEVIMGASDRWWELQGDPTMRLSWPPSPPGGLPLPDRVDGWCRECGRFDTCDRCIPPIAG